MNKNALIALGLALASASAWAANETTATYESTESNRMNHKINLVAGLLMDQFSVLGVSAGYQVSDAARLRLGLGTIGIGTSISAGAKFMVPGWNVTPTLGVDLAYVSGTLDFGTLGTTRFGGVIPMTSLGVEWTASGGFFLQGGLAVCPQALSAGAIPFLGLGASI